MKYLVVGALFVLSMITYIDRVCITTAKDPISRELGLSDSAMGAVFGAFALGYALAQIPAGWFADRFGARLALAGVVATWSALTALTGWAWSFTSLVIIRFLFGVGEAGAFPGSARAIVNWLPAGERGRANGVLFSGSRLGAAVAFPLLAWMLSRWDWRASFVILGAGGVVWAMFWLLWFRDRPPGVPPPVVTRAEAALPLARIFRSKILGLAMFQYFASNFTFFICLSWMLPYLKRQYKLGDGEAAAYAMAPLLLGATSQWATGWIVDRLYRSSWRSWSRRLPAIAGFALAAAGVTALTAADTAWAAAACFTVAAFGADMTISPSWVFCADVAGKNAGSVSGSMNMLGNFGSFVSANAFPMMERAAGSAAPYFWLAGLLNAVGILCWLGMNSVDREHEL
ncbi:MAG: MFS transporter [Bryobacteraceae bacterium]|nr:MFS transporter [Bryobacteraceae bacterium]